MPTARELLEQADALMRRNRAQIAAADDIPELTEEVALAGEHELPTTRTSAANDAAAPVAEHADDVPELTDAVAYVDAVSIEALPDEEVTRWLESEVGEHSITGAGPDSIALVPPTPLHVVGAVPVDAPDETPALDATATPPAPSSAAAVLAAFSGAAATPPAPAADYAFEAIERERAASSEPPSGDVPSEEDVASTSVAAVETAEEAPEAAEEVDTERTVADSDDSARWAALAEEIRMQVLQRIDIFTDTGLQQQLTARLQPIVDRASADLVAAINQHVGTLLRAYVAEAIEREIEKWRQEGR